MVPATTIWMAGWATTRSMAKPELMPCSAMKALICSLAETTQTHCLEGMAPTRSTERPVTTSDGGAGTDKLLGGTGTNSLYADYWTSTFLPSSGFAHFDWFDKNLKDPAVRSQIREGYRDGVLNRTDMLNVFKTVAIDGLEAPRLFNGTVTTNEFSDLKTLANSKLNFQVDTKFFTQRVVLGDLANAHFQGQSLGNLAANVSGDHLTKLVDKWFRGMDLPAHPDVISDPHATKRYKQPVREWSQL